MFLTWYWTLIRPSPMIWLGRDIAPTVGSGRSANPIGRTGQLAQPDRVPVRVRRPWTRTQNLASLPRGVFFSFSTASMAVSAALRNPNSRRLLGLSSASPLYYSCFRGAISGPLSFLEQHSSLNSNGGSRLDAELWPRRSMATFTRT